MKIKIIDPNQIVKKVEIVYPEEYYKNIATEYKTKNMTALQTEVDILKAWAAENESKEVHLYINFYEGVINYYIGIYLNKHDLVRKGIETLQALQIDKQYPAPHKMKVEAGLFLVDKPLLYRHPLPEDPLGQIQQAKLMAESIQYKSGQLKSELLELVLCKNKPIEIVWDLYMAKKAEIELEDDIVFFYKHLAVLSTRKGDMELIIPPMKKSLEVSLKYGEAESVVLAYNGLGITHYRTYKYKEALDYYYKAIDICDRIGYQFFKIKIQINLASLFDGLYSYNQAIDYYDKILNNKKILLPNEIAFIVYFNQGLLYENLKEYTKAMDSFSMALSKNEKDETIDKAECLALIGLCAIQNKDIEKALFFSNKAKILLKKLGVYKIEYFNKIALAHIHYYQKNYKKAIYFSTEAIKLTKEVVHKRSQIDGYDILIKTYETIGEFQKACECYKKRVILDVELAEEIRDRRVTALEIEYETKEKEKEIEQLKKDAVYHQEIQQKNIEIAAKNKQLEEYTTTLQQLTSGIGHDLKEPIRMIKSYLNLLVRSKLIKESPRSDEFIHYISDGADRMHLMLEALMTYSKSGYGKIKYTSVDLNMVIWGALNNLKLRIKEANAIVEWEENFPKVYSSRAFLLQLVQNLIANAVKFRVKDRQVKIKIYWEAEASGYRIFVKDNGIGIEKQFLEAIFVIFRRLHSKSDYPGSGIGLATCQKIAERLGEGMAVSSIPNEGSTFSFTINHQIE